MALPPREVGKVVSIANLTASGVIGAASTVTDTRVVLLTQTTTGLTLTLPVPSDATVVGALDVVNLGTAAFTMYGIIVTPGSTLWCLWTGSAWETETIPFIKTTVAGLNAMINVPIGTPAYATNGRALTGGAVGTFNTQAAGAGTGCAVTCATSSGTSSTWVVNGTTVALAA